MSTARRIIGPFNRVEGDLEVTVEIRAGQVSAAWCNSLLFRGFEQILPGKDPRDALVYTPRICGICSVSQSLAAAHALAEAQGITPAENGRIAANLILAAENLADHLSHFYLFFMPDFARSDYANQAWYETITERFTAQRGTAAREVLPARAQFLHLTGILAGKWPHSLALQPGGTTRAIETQERLRLLSLIGVFRAFLEHTVFTDTLERVATLDSETALNTWAEHHSGSDFGQFLNLSRALQLDQLGRLDQARVCFMSYGAYPENNGHLWPAGVWRQNKVDQLNPTVISEDISHSWLHGQNTAQHPYQGRTLPGNGLGTSDDPSNNSGDGLSGYSWCKAPRLDGQVVEVGALARQMVAGHPLIRALVAANGATVHSRVVARVLELALLVPQMEHWARALRPREPFCHHAAQPTQAQGAGLVEAARGSLGHWLRIEQGRIANYQIIAPTTWNFSPRDAENTPGALEQALVGTPVTDASSVKIQHIVRSFDPCMVCTVH